jgi:UDP-galactopyranose mutase
MARYRIDRSIRFHNRSENITYGTGYAVKNFTGAGKYTRETDWSVLPRHQLEGRMTKTITLEEPCDYKENAFERYYPVKTSDDCYKGIVEKYRALSAENLRMRFIGRCGTYQYLDMDQVINQSLKHVRSWLSQQ